MFAETLDYSTVFRRAHAKRASSRTGDSAKECTLGSVHNYAQIMSSVKIGVVLLVCTMTQCSTRCKKQYCWHKVLLHSWRHLNSHYMWQQGAVCWWWCLWGSRWSRWCASDEYQVSGRQFWLKQMCWYGWQNPTGFQWYQKLPSNPLSVCLKNPCVHVLFYFLLITDKKGFLIIQLSKSGRQIGLMKALIPANLFWCKPSIVYLQFVLQLRGFSGHGSCSFWHAITIAIRHM